MRVYRLLTLHDESVPEPAAGQALTRWATRLCDADDRFNSGLVLLLADSAPFAWSGHPDPEDATEVFKADAWLALAATLPAGRREELAELLREAGYVHIADQVPT